MSCNTKKTKHFHQKGSTVGVKRTRRRRPGWSCLNCSSDSVNEWPTQFDSVCHSVATGQYTSNLNSVLLSKNTLESKRALNYGSVLIKMAPLQYLNFGFRWPGWKWIKSRKKLGQLFQAKLLAVLWKKIPKGDNALLFLSYNRLTSGIPSTQRMTDSSCYNFTPALTKKCETHRDIAPLNPGTITHRSNWRAGGGGFFI